MIEFIDVCKTYKNGTEALKNFNLKIEDGEFVFVVGSSGAGKSTFLKLIVKEEDVTSGKLIVGGKDLSKMKKREVPYFRRKMGIVFQDFRLIDKMTVYDNVAFAMHIVGSREREIRRRVPLILNLVGLQNKARRYPKELSGGEQQRVGLARAIINNPELIIADEPTGNVDPSMSLEIVELLKKINENGTTVLMVTHEHTLVKKFNYRIVEIGEGMVKRDFPMREEKNVYMYEEAIN